MKSLEHSLKVESEQPELLQVVVKPPKVEESNTIIDEIIKSYTDMSTNLPQLKSLAHSLRDDDNYTENDSHADQDGHTNTDILPNIKNQKYRDSNVKNPPHNETEIYKDSNTNNIEMKRSNNKMNQERKNHRDFDETEKEELIDDSPICWNQNLAIDGTHLFYTFIIYLRSKQKSGGSEEEIRILTLYFCIYF